MSIPVAADWLVCIDAGSLGLLDILTIINLLNYAIASFVELA